jgi:outer membrane protein
MREISMQQATKRESRETMFSGAPAWRGALTCGARVVPVLIFITFILAGTALAQTSAPAAPAPSPITLQQAVTIALEKNPLRKAALADTHAAAAGVREARSALLPHIMFSETATRGNDPVFVFGTRLRQQRFTPADFALNRLNTPTPVGNFGTRFGGQWNLFDSFASWRNVGRARDMQDAANHQLERSDQELVFSVVQAYFGLLLAGREQEVAEQAQRTAEAILQHSKSRYEAGLVVESDYLSAQVNAASRQQQLIQARNAVSLAQAQLDNALGLTTVNAWEPAQALPETTLPLASLADLEQHALAARPDLKRIASEQAAQEKGVAAAKSAFGPRVNVFAGWEADNPTLFAGGGGNNWTGGVELQFDLFAGGAKAARLSREKAIGDRVAAMRQVAENGVRLEVRRAFYDTDAARQQVEVARAATQQAQESLRINQNRYDSGLANITDLLRVEEAARRAQADYWEAVYRYRTSYARLELATGSLNANAPVVTQ